MAPGAGPEARSESLIRWPGGTAAATQGRAAANRPTGSCRRPPLGAARPQPCGGPAKRRPSEPGRPGLCSKSTTERRVDRHGLARAGVRVPGPATHWIRVRLAVTAAVSAHWARASLGQPQAPRVRVNPAPKAPQLRLRSGAPVQLNDSDSIQRRRRLRGSVRLRRRLRPLQPSLWQSLGAPSAVASGTAPQRRPHAGVPWGAQRGGPPRRLRRRRRRRP